MWNKMQRANNPYEGHTRKQRKAEIREILKRKKALYKDAKSNGGTMTKPNLGRAKKEYELMLSDVWFVNNLYQVNVDYIQYKDLELVYNNKNIPKYRTICRTILT